MVAGRYLAAGDRVSGPGGTIRCHHGHWLKFYEQVSHMVTLQPPNPICQCELKIPSTAFDAIVTGSNFTHVFFASEAELKAYLSDNRERFEGVGTSYSQTDYGLWHLVF